MAVVAPARQAALAAAQHKPFHGPALSLSEMANPDKSCAWWDQTVAWFASGILYMKRNVASAIIS